MTRRNLGARLMPAAAALLATMDGVALIILLCHRMGLANRVSRCARSGTVYVSTITMPILSRGAGTAVLVRGMLLLRQQMAVVVVVVMTVGISISIVLCAA